MILKDEIELTIDQLKFDNCMIYDPSNITIYLTKKEFIWEKLIEWGFSKKDAILLTKIATLILHDINILKNYKNINLKEINSNDFNTMKILYIRSFYTTNELIEIFKILKSIFKPYKSIKKLSKVLSEINCKKLPIIY